MEALTLMALINGLLSTAFNLWKIGRQIHGTDKIPEWTDIMRDNTLLQQKIDQELSK